MRRAVDDDEDIVFLGWEPHPMNANFDLEYLSGGEDFFGGEGVVHTVTRQGFVEECPNAGKLLQQMEFSLPMENEIMAAILNDGADPDEAAAAWLAKHPDMIDGWLDGVTTKGLSPNKTNWALPINEGPFEAFVTTTGVTFTFGGLKIDEKGVVQDVSDHSIPGLYAAGELVGGLFYENYPGGSGLMAGSVFGKIAGENAAAYSSGNG